MKKIIFLLTAIFLAGVLNCAQARPLAIGDKAQDFSLPDLNNQTVSLQRILQNKQPVAFVFWASWCPECRKQLPQVNEVAKKYKGRVQFYSINTNDSQSGASSYVKREGIEFPTLVDTSGAVADSYGILGVPTMIFIDQDGIIKSTDLDPRQIDTYLSNTK